MERRPQPGGHPDGHVHVDARDRPLQPLCAMHKSGEITQADIVAIQGEVNELQDDLMLAEAKAREITEYRVRARKKAAGMVGAGAATSMEQMLSRLKDKTTEEMTLLVKGDVQGSVEAIRSSVEGLGNEEVKARVVHGAVGGINESDVMLAKSSEAPIIGFNVRANRQAKALAEKEGVEIRYYSVIYDLLDDVKGVLEGMLAPEKRETFIGYAEILEVFNITKLGKVAGCKVTEGKVERGAGVRLLRAWRRHLPVAVRLPVVHRRRGS